MTKQARIKMGYPIDAYRCSWTCPHCATPCTSQIEQGTRQKTVRCGKCRQGVMLIGLEPLAEEWHRHREELRLERARLAAIDGPVRQTSTARTAAAGDHSTSRQPGRSQQSTRRALVPAQRSPKRRAARGSAKKGRGRK